MTGGLEEEQTARGKWKLVGHATFKRQDYPLSGEYDSEEGAIEAARARLRELDEEQPPESSGGQEGMQDQVFILSPDGARTRIKN